MRISSLCLHLQPTVHDRAKRLGFQVVELIPALAPRFDQPCVLEDVEELRDRLPAGAQPMLVRQPGADLEQRLAIPLGQLVEARSPRRVGQGLEYVTQAPRMTGKLSLACPAGAS